MLDELLFHWGRRVICRLRPPEPDRSHWAELEPLRGRLQVLASTLVGQSMSLSASADGPGGVVGTRIYLPPALGWLADVEQNVELYRLRLVYGLCLQEAARQVGWTQGPRLDQDERVLASLLLWRCAGRRALAAFPGLVEVHTRALARVPEGDPDLCTHLQRNEALPGRWGELQCAAESGELPVSALQEAALQLRRDLGRRAGWFAARHVPVPVLLELSGLVCNPAALGMGLEGPGNEPAKAGSLPRGREHQGKSREEVEIYQDEEDPERDNPVLHLFEKIETAEEYQGTQRLKDGTDELEDHAEALEELHMGQVIRTRQTSDSLYRADLVIETRAGEEEEAAADEGALFYDEWDARRRRYRKGHCRLYLQQDLRSCAPEQLRAHQQRLRQSLRQPLAELRAAFASIAQAERLRSRQRDGEELDLDAFVDGHGRRAAGQEGEDRVWWARRPRQRELAVLLLIDGSLSADSWVANRRVLDIEREAAFMLGEVLSGQGIRFGIAAFHSNTRHDCRYLQIQHFGESWAQAQAKLFGLLPQGFTRIGPALRHATKDLVAQRARRRLLLVLTDGKATDQDAYEGRHGMADVRQAVREAEQLGIQCVSLAVEKDARHYLPALFGAGGYAVLPRPELLPARMALVLERFAGVQA